MAAPSATEDIHDANIRYHDMAAGRYDAKWGIGYGEQARGQVEAKLRKALGPASEPRFPRVLEVGAGTGYFGLNLLRAGIVEDYTATDVSQGMLDVLAETADRLGLRAGTACCLATELPVPDASFDLVCGHAVLHHLPDLDGAFAEFARVLAPGGSIAFCGEPSRYGDRIAAAPKRVAHALAPAWRALVGAGAARQNGHSTEEASLETVVDVHAFTPSELAGPARAAGFEDIRVSGEELVSSIFGWANRALESTAEPSELPWLWYQYAYRGYLGLRALDRVLLEPRLPPAVFYNLLLSARAPRG